MFDNTPHWIELFVGLVVWIGASARLTRLATQDSFPPVAALRAWWDKVTNDNDWSLLAHCHWCLAPWIVLVLGVWGYLTELGPAWWILTVWMTASYAASWAVHHDED